MKASYLESSLQIVIYTLAAAIGLLAGRAGAADDPQENAKPVELAVGDAAPAFECRDDQGNVWTSVDHVGKQFVVIYFFPADFTSGCRTQARSFRDNMNQLAADGITVVGVSGDSMSNHELFKSVENLNFTLLADEEGSVAKKFGVPLTKGGEVRPRDEQRKPILDAEGNPLVLKRGVTAARWTFIIGKDGKILYKNTNVNPVNDSKQVAAFIEDLQKKVSSRERRLTGSVGDRIAGSGKRIEFQFSALTVSVRSRDRIQDTEKSLPAPP